MTKMLSLGDRFVTVHLLSFPYNDFHKAHRSHSQIINIQEKKTYQCFILFYLRLQCMQRYVHVMTKDITLNAQCKLIYAFYLFT